MTLVYQAGKGPPARTGWQWAAQDVSRLNSTLTKPAVNPKGREMKAWPIWSLNKDRCMLIPHGLAKYES